MGPLLLLGGLVEGGEVLIRLLPRVRAFLQKLLQLVTIRFLSFLCQLLLLVEVTHLAVLVGAFAFLEELDLLLPDFPLPSLLAQLQQSNLPFLPQQLQLELLNLLF
mmetsp:Transcript_14516/g.14123  ORF Transcript_14516/g.14123 Transcript_14516/m.14123 type:complete len:106 (+) Transcript_14516:1111-1428(+)